MSEKRWEAIESLTPAQLKRLWRESTELASSVRQDNRRFARKLTEALIIRTWERGEPLSPHLAAEVAAAKWRGRKTGIVVPLEPGDPVPGCGCPRCSRTPENAPIRTAELRRPQNNAQTTTLDVEAARRSSILEVAARLGLGSPKQAGREYVVRCPLHDDRHPSMRINPTKGTWYCDPCAEGGDTIALVQAVQRCTFLEAVRELTA